MGSLAAALHLLLQSGGTRASLSSNPTPSHLITHLITSLLLPPLPSPPPLCRQAYAGEGETIGAKTWPSAPVLGTMLATWPGLVRGRRVLEIGEEEERERGEAKGE